MHKKILITGISGSGKSTIANALKEAGEQSIDLEEIPDLFTMYHKDSRQPVMTEYENHDLAWVQNVEWTCDVQELKEILHQPTAAHFYAGSADNIHELIPLFDLVILLQIDEQTFRDRLSNRTNNNWGQTKEVQDWLWQQTQAFEEKIKKEGAIPIDATQDRKSIIKDIQKVVEVKR